MNDSLNVFGDDRRNERVTPPAPVPVPWSSRADDEASPMATPASPPRARWRALMLDGRRAWGALDISPTRHGITRYRLTVFPPGIDPTERRLLRAWRAWPTWGAVLWLLVQIALGGATSSAAAFGISTAAYLGMGAVLFFRVANVRAQVRGVCVVRIAGFANPHVAALYAELCSLVATLDDADARLQRGALSAAGHEAIWWQVYNRLRPIGADARAAHGAR